MAKSILSQIKEAMASLQEVELFDLVSESLNAGSNPLKVIEALREGIWEVGEKYEEGGYFISDLIIAGEMMKRNIEILKPHLKTGEISTHGTIVLGSALGDIHDIGKEIVKSLLIAEGFEVYDLGVDVTPSKFAEECQGAQASVLGISALLSTSTPAAAMVIDELKKRGVRDKVMVILGGAPVTDGMVKEYGVDAAVNDAIKGIRLIRSRMQ